jgi:hypothetical protein
MWTSDYCGVKPSYKDHYKGERDFADPLGHKSIGITQRYTHLMSSEIQAEIYDQYNRVLEPYFFETLEEAAI